MGHRDVKGDTKECFMFHSWFSSNRQDEADMDVGEDMIGMVKTNKTLSYKDTIENLTNNWPGGF